MDETVPTAEVIEAKPETSTRSARVRTWLEVALGAAAVTAIPVTHFLTAGFNKGYLLGTFETTVAGAIASLVVGTLAGGRLIDHARKLPIDRAIAASVIGTCVVVAGASPIPLLVADMNRRYDVAVAYMKGADELMRAGRIAETRPHEEVRKVTGAVTMELLANSFRPTYPDVEMNEFDRKISEKWKSIGFDKSPDL